MKNILYIIAAVILAATACKSEEGYSGYTIVPLRENERPVVDEETGEVLEDHLEVPRDLVGHIFLNVEGTHWRPLSLADAEHGVLSDTVGGEHKMLYADGTFTQEPDGQIFIGNFQGGARHFLVLCDRESRAYAWRELRTVGHAGTVFLNVLFQPWRLRNTEAATYTDRGWTMANPLRAPDLPEPPEPQVGTATS